MSRELRDKLKKAEEEVEKIRNEIRCERLDECVSVIKNYLTNHCENEYFNDCSSWSKKADTLEKICDALTKSSFDTTFKLEICDKIVIGDDVKIVPNRFMISVGFEVYELYEPVSFFEELNKSFKTFPEECWLRENEIDSFLNEMSKIMGSDCI